jgi:hypothetical protein
MGLLVKLLTFPVSGPVLGVKWVLDRVVEEAERELYDEDSIRRAIAELGMQRDLGELTEEEYEAAEDALVERLQQARARKRAAEAGGPPEASPGASQGASQRAFRGASRSGGPGTR